MSRQLRNTLLALGLGSVLQRLAQLLSVVLIARELGATEMGSYALGLSAGTILAMLCGAGIRSVVAREMVADPDRAGDWIRAAVTLRLLGGGSLFAVYGVAVWLLAPAPLFWLLCGASVFPLAFDLKGLADSASRTPQEVALEGIASWLHLGLVAAVLALASENHLEWLAAAYLAGRAAYALGAATRLKSFPSAGFRPGLGRLVTGAGPVSMTQTAFDTLCLCDVLLVTALAGREAAGIYAVAQRIVIAASLPAVQLSRLLVPHLNHSAGSGDSTRTLETALRASAYVTLPLCLGGWVVAEPLCAVFGGEFSASGWTLRWLLCSCVLLGVGSQVGNTLFAMRLTGRYMLCLWVGGIVQIAAWCLLIPALGAEGGALATCFSYSAIVATSLVLLRPVLSFRILQPLVPALCLSGAVGLAAWLSVAAGVIVQIGAGAALFVLGMWYFELRRGWSRFGDGLSRASGLGTSPVER